MENRAEVIHQPKQRTWLKLMRIEKGLTQVDTAKACGLSQNIYSYIEQGRMYPSEKDAKKLAKFLINVQL